MYQTDSDWERQPDLMGIFLDISPEFESKWQAHIKRWAPERAGAYNDLAELALFVVDSYDQGASDAVARVLDLVEELLQRGDPKITGLLVVGLLEDIQTISSNRPFGSKVFVPFLGPISKQFWYELLQVWKGKRSLMDVIRSE